jgi:hypothetical protein
MSATGSYPAVVTPEGHVIMSPVQWAMATFVSRSGFVSKWPPGSDPSLSVPSGNARGTFSVRRVGEWVGLLRPVDATSMTRIMRLVALRWIRRLRSRVGGRCRTMPAWMPPERTRRLEGPARGVEANRGARSLARCVVPDDASTNAGSVLSHADSSVPLHLIAFARGAAEAGAGLIEAGAVGPGGAGADVGGSLAESTEERRLAAMPRAKVACCLAPGRFYIHPPAPPLPVAARRIPTMNRKGC